MKNWNELFLDADSGIHDSVEGGTAKETPAYGVIILLEARSSAVLRLYDASQNRDELEEKLQKEYNDEIKRLNPQERLDVYLYLRDNAMLYKMLGNSFQHNRHLEAADYLRRELGLKIK